jgi:hypothetical protein
MRKIFIVTLIMLIMAAALSGAALAAGPPDTVIPAPDSNIEQLTMGGFLESQSLGNSKSMDVALGDLDGDGDLDAFVANDGPNKVWLNDGKGVFSDSGALLGGSNSASVDLGDIDNDGDLDAFVVGIKEQLWLNNGNGTFTGSSLNINMDLANDGALADLDGDGDLDAFIANSSVGDRVILNMGKGVLNDSGLSLGSSSSFGVALGDLNDDNYPDAFIAKPNGGNEVWLNNGNATFKSNEQHLGKSSGWGVVLGNFRWENTLDAFVVNTNNEPNTFYMNYGIGIFNISEQLLGASDSRAADAADLDGDGDLDVFVANYGQSNTVWLNDGKGVFKDSGQPIGSANSRGVALGDVNGDGKIDAFVANIGPNKVWINMNSLPGKTSQPSSGGVSITSFSPNSGGTGTVVEINGSGFTGATSVTIGGVSPQAWVIASDSKIVAEVGGGATGNIVVTTPQGTATSASSFTFTGQGPGGGPPEEPAGTTSPPPSSSGGVSITSFTPASGDTGTVVEINGSGFTGATSVTIGGIAVQARVVESDSKIIIEVGGGATGNIVVTTPQGTATSASSFTFSGQQPPTEGQPPAASPTSPATTPPASTGTSGVTLSAGTMSVAPGGTIKVPINVNQVNGIGSMSFMLTYNPQVVQVVSVTSGSLLTNALAVPNYAQPPDVLFAFISQNGVSGSGSVAYIEFQALGADGSSSFLQLSQVTASDVSGQTISLGSKDGTLTIGSSLKGDYNGDGKVSEVDALAALQMSVNMIQVDTRMDMNGDGKVTVQDALLILQSAVSAIPITVP